MLVSSTVRPYGVPETSSMGTLSPLAAGTEPPSSSRATGPEISTVSSEMSPYTAFRTVVLSASWSRATERAPVSTAARRRAAAAPSSTRSAGLRPPSTTRGGSAATTSATAWALASAGDPSGAPHQTTRSTPLAATASATGRGPATTAATCPAGPPRLRATVIRLPIAGCSATTIQALTLTVRVLSLILRARARRARQAVTARPLRAVP